MPPKKKFQKAKPSMTTVKESFKVSDLLRVEVCDPIKGQLDKIKVCAPNLKEPVMCLPDRICRPLTDCLPTICRPGWICKPDIICSPWFCYPRVWVEKACLPTQICGPVTEEMECGPLVYEVPGEIPFEMREVLEELKTIKAEIAELKKAIK